MWTYREATGPRPASGCSVSHSPRRTSHRSARDRLVPRTHAPVARRHAPFQEER